METLYTNLHKLYPVQKTLRFELKPIGNTKEYIEKNGILNIDEHRAEIYKKVKKYCDEYHKYFIESCLKNAKLNNLYDYYDLYLINKRDEKQEKQFKKVKELLRKEIKEYFVKDDKKYKGLFGEEIIKSYLQVMYQEDKEKLNDIKEFEKFTTYFTGFNTNRKNMYSDEEKSTAISYRLINENLPTFINNLKIYEKIIKVNPELKEIVYKELEEYMQVNSLDEVFDIDYYNDVLTETGIETYNLIISGKATENGKIKGINEYINEYNQKNRAKFPKLKELYKQILSDKTTISFKFEEIKSDEDIIELIKDYYKNFTNIANNLNALMENIDKYDLSKIYINNDLSITDISKKIYDDWRKIKNALIENYDNTYTGKAKKSSEKYSKQREESLKKDKIYSIKFLQELLNDNLIVEYFSNSIDKNNILTDINNKYKAFEQIQLDENIPKKLLNDEKSTLIIKELLDSIKVLQEFIKLLIPKDNTIEKDEKFYSELLGYYDVLKEIIGVYNKTRNYLTQKPYSTEKVKINFNCSTLLNGWDSNKEKDNLGVLFIKDNNYYLGIINAKNKKILDNKEQDINENFYKKMEYKLLPGPNKMLPKVFFSSKGQEIFKPSQEINDIYKSGVFKKGEYFDIDSCHKLIDFYKQSIAMHEDWKKFNFKFKSTNEYNDISEFYRDIEKQGYKITYSNWSEEYINSLVREGKLYLFQIYNKDFSEYSKGMPNLHTLYWKAIFDEENLKNVVYKLNGNAEIFYRKSSIEVKSPTHPANVPINNKNKDTIEKGRITSVFSYDLIKNKRYTVDKFQFHVPITMNFNNLGNNYINPIVNKYLKYNSEDVYVIGIDRGERNLLYYSVIDSKGKIVEQDSLNNIANEYKGIKYETDYHDLLDKKEKERDNARKNWKSIENIKELKEGYMSQVINKLAELLKKYKAIIVIEDLNKGFKNSRIKVEKQVYQKFEKMLIDKLNYLVYKRNSNLEEGGILNAYQLTNKFESFNKLGRQTGILFYIPAWCTSKIDPVTGFVNLFYIKQQSLEKSNEFVKNFEDIRFNDKENYFEFDIDYEKFTDRLNDSKRFWTICTNGNRIKTFRNSNKNNEFDNEDIELTKEFLRLFEMYKIDFNNIKDSILANADSKFYNAKKELDGFEGFTSLFKLTVQMRNSRTGEAEDYLISPVKDKNGKFYNSNDGIKSLPIDADANGAYNIARKGLMLIEQIKNTADQNLGKVKFNITNKEWLNYVQNEGNN